MLRISSPHLMAIVARRRTGEQCCFPYYRGFCHTEIANHVPGKRSCDRILNSVLHTYVYNIYIMRTFGVQ